MAIEEFKDDYFFLSNFYLRRIRYGIELNSKSVVIFKSAEHAFQAAKSTNDNDKRLIADSHTPGLAKSRGQLIPLRSDWEKIKKQVMYEIVKAKFVQSSKLRKLLLKTGTKKLIEGNWWHDTYWGVCNGVGENHLGKILMRVRKELG